MPKKLLAGIVAVVVLALAVWVVPAAFGNGGGQQLDSGDHRCDDCAETVDDDPACGLHAGVHDRSVVTAGGRPGRPPGDTRLRRKGRRPKGAAPSALRRRRVACAGFEPSSPRDNLGQRSVTRGPTTRTVVRASHCRRREAVHAVAASAQDRPRAVRRVPRRGLDHASRHRRRHPARTCGRVVVRAGRRGARRQGLRGLGGHGGTAFSRRSCGRRRAGHRPSVGAALGTYSGRFAAAAPRRDRRYRGVRRRRRRGGRAGRDRRRHTGPT